jgi:hypothetical protein
MGLEKLIISHDDGGEGAYNGGKVPILTSWTVMSLSQVGLTTLFNFFMIRPMMNWYQPCTLDSRSD